jgi:hypothetical protein
MLAAYAHAAFMEETTTSPTRLEQRLIEAVTQGALLDLAGEKPVDETAMRSWGPDRTLRAEVLRDIVRGRLATDPDPRGVQLRGARIAGRIDLENISSELDVALFDCFLPDGVLLRGARLLGLTLLGCWIGNAGKSDPKSTGAAIDADRFTTRVMSLTRSTCTADSQAGAVRMVGAHIRGHLGCGWAHLTNSGGPALIADGLHVDHDILFSGGFTATGAGEHGTVRLAGAHIGGVLDCAEARLTNPSGPALHATGLQVNSDIYLSEGFTASGGSHHAVIALSGARIGGRLSLETSNITRAAHDGGPLIDLDGTTYTGLPGPNSLPYWLHLLRTGTPDYAAQPYQQFAAVHHAAGHDHAVRRILIEQRRDQIKRKAIRGWDRTWACLTGLTLGYGYQPWRALIGLLLVLTVSIGYTWNAGHSGGLAHTSRTATPMSACTSTELVGVGLDPE